MKSPTLRYHPLTLSSPIIPNKVFTKSGCRKSLSRLVSTLTECCLFISSNWCYIMIHNTSGLDSYNLVTGCRFIFLSSPLTPTYRRFDSLMSALSSLKSVLNLGQLPKFQCWTVGAIFTFGRCRMFGHEKLRPSAVDRSRSRRIKKT